MNILTLLDNIMSVVRSDADLKSWINSTYGGTVTCYTGVDQQNPPAQAEHPLIILWPEGEAKGDGVENRLQNVIRARLQIFNESGVNKGKTIVTDAHGTWVKFNGVYEINAFRDKFITAIKSNFSTIGLSWMMLQISYEVVDEFPIFKAEISMEWHEIISSTDEIYL